MIARASGATGRPRGAPARRTTRWSARRARARVPKRPITNHAVLNEAYHYAKPSAFSRGMRVAAGAVHWIFISGTASIGPDGRTLHVGDFARQLARTYGNLTALLASEGADWHDVARTTVYLKDMKHYDWFNKGRRRFFDALGLAPPPASTCIQAHLCREELLVEMELIAVVPAACPSGGNEGQNEGETR